MLSDFKTTSCSEIARLSKFSKQSVHRYLQRLESVGIVESQQCKNKKLYNLCVEHELYQQILELSETRNDRQRIHPDEEWRWRAD